MLAAVFFTTSGLMQTLSAKSDFPEKKGPWTESQGQSERIF